MTLLAVAFTAASIFGAPVSPNPKSLLKGKRVLVVEATNWNGNSHLNPKANALAKLNLIKTSVGITNFTVVDNVSSYTLATLTKYDIIVFNYVFNTQEALKGTFGEAFKQWLALGDKGWMGYHTSGANDVGEWPWYRDSVTVMRYHVHSTNAQSGKMFITKDPAIRAHPILAGMDTTFTGTDEWYDFDLLPKASQPELWADCKPIYYLDESVLTTKPTRPMNPHPMAWFREDAKKNRFFYAAYIHSDIGSSSDFFHSSLLRGLEYVAGYDSTTSITSGGNSIQTMPALSYITQSKVLEVGAQGKHRVRLYSGNGRFLAEYKGTGPRAYRPEAFENPGLYIVRYFSKSRSFSQKILVY